MNKLPKIKENLLVQELADEVLIYDQSTNKSYCLNETAKTVFNHCDGVKTFDELNLPEDIIYLSLDELKEHNLIQSDYVSPFVGINRREVIRKVGLATMLALPVITGIVAPKAINAASPASCIAVGTYNPNPPCNGLACLQVCQQTATTQCCSGIANTAVINLFTNNTCTCSPPPV